ncbi:MAG: helix-turn-helix domain-containing protein [Alphaproteobacteria bacterium]
MTNDLPPHDVSSGNVFDDLGFENPPEELLKAALSHEITRLIRARGLTQKEAGAVLGLHQPEVSALMRGMTGQFSIERLFRCLMALDRDIEIVLREKSGEGQEPRLSVRAA